MQNWYAIETDAEFRRQQWRAAAAADARAAVAQAGRARRNWVQFPAIALAHLKQQVRVRPGWVLVRPLDTAHCTVCNAATGN